MHLEHLWKKIAAGYLPAALVANTKMMSPGILSFIQGKVCFLDQNPLQRHSVAAALSGLEKITIAGPLSMLIRNLVGVVLPLEGYRKRVDRDPFPFGSVLFRFLNFSYHPGIHHIHLPKQENKKHAA
jgi:hypothetical protein